jgi:hypothetical protein
LVGIRTLDVDACWIQNHGIENGGKAGFWKYPETSTALHFHGQKMSCPRNVASGIQKSRSTQEITHAEIRSSPALTFRFLQRYLTSR